jgi:hypothetical protein
MNEIEKLVSEKTGLPPEVSKMVVDVAYNFIKGKLPPEIAGQLDGLLGVSTGAPTAAASNPEEGLLDKAKGMLGGLFGGGETS